MSQKILSLALILYHACKHEWLDRVIIVGHLQGYESAWTLAMKYITSDILHLLPRMTAVMHEALQSIPFQKLDTDGSTVSVVCLLFMHSLFIYHIFQTLSCTKFLEWRFRGKIFCSLLVIKIQDNLIQCFPGKNVWKMWCMNCRWYLHDVYQVKQLFM
jgi:hypothetical protein